MEKIHVDLRLVQESDIPILYEMLEEFDKIPFARVSGKPTPPFQKSKEFCLKYLNDNQNHEYKKWYVIVDGDKPLGNLFITKKHIIGYHVLKKYHGNGIGTQAVLKLMELHPCDRYFAIIHEENKKSLNLIKKLGFKSKAIMFEKTSK